MTRKTKPRLIPLVPILERMGACSAAREWLANRRTFRQAWNAIPPSHYDWAVWLVNKFGAELDPEIRSEAHRAFPSQEYTGTLTGSDSNYLYHTGGGGPILRFKAVFVGLAPA